MGVYIIISLYNLHICSSMYIKHIILKIEKQGELVKIKLQEPTGPCEP